MEYKTSPEKRAANKRWREANRETWKESYTNSRKKNPAKAKATRKVYRTKNAEKLRRQNSAYKQQQRLEMRAAIFELLGGAKCIRCGYDADIRALQLDHINGGGYQERQTLRSPDTYYKSILERKGEGFQVLCANCNQIKRYERGEVTPHKLPDLL